jgi:hypothetical protein
MIVQRHALRSVLLVLALLTSTVGTSLAQDGERAAMSFFITSTGPGNGADLGGLASHWRPQRVPEAEPGAPT